MYKKLRFEQLEKREMLSCNVIQLLDVQKSEVGFVEIPLRVLDSVPNEDGSNREHCITDETTIIDWGDGTTNEFTRNLWSNGHHNIQHQYLESGDYRIRATLGDIASATSSISANVPSPGDANGDGVFNSEDLVRLFQAGTYETAQREPRMLSWRAGDFNGDGRFDSSDLLLAFRESGNRNVMSCNAIQVVRTESPGDLGSVVMQFQVVDPELNEDGSREGPCFTDETVIIDWGDGTTNEFTNRSWVSAVQRIEHQYLESGDYVIRATLGDIDSASTPPVTANVPAPGDANNDGVFNSADLVHLFQVGPFDNHQREPRMLSWHFGDFNGDGRFDSSDLILAFRDGEYQNG